MTEMKYIMLYKDHLPTLREMEYDEVGRLVVALLQYATEGKTDVDMKGEKYVFSMLKAQIDRDSSVYSARCKTNLENGKKGGRPRKETDNQTVISETQENPSVFSETEKRQYKDKDKDKDNIESDAVQRKRFTPPTVNQVSEFVRENGLSNVDPQQFVDFYTSKGWVVGKSGMKDWKAACRNWNRNERGGSKPPSRIESDVADLDNLYA